MDEEDIEISDLDEAKFYAKTWENIATRVTAAYQNLQKDILNLKTYNFKTINYIKLADVEKLTEESNKKAKGIVN